GEREGGRGGGGLLLASEGLPEGEGETAEGVALEVVDGIDLRAEDFEGAVEGADDLLTGVEGLPALGEALREAEGQVDEVLPAVVAPHVSPRPDHVQGGAGLEPADLLG